MIRGLFARLTAEPRRGQALFDLCVGEARERHWFADGAVPDTVNGRFAVLATVAALVMVRLERGGVEGHQTSVALTERLVESLDAEIRQMGLGDPALGKQVRRLVGAVAGRVERWRELVDSLGPWTAEVRRSLYLDEPAEPAAVEHGEAALRRSWERVSRSSVEDLAQGRIR